MNLDIAFSDHHMTKETLEDFGKVVAAIHARADQPELGFWAFIRYLSLHHPSILGVTLDPELTLECDQLLSQISLPPVKYESTGDNDGSE